MSGRPPVPARDDGPGAPEPVSRWRLLRTLGVFELKLALDGVKDLVLAPLALAAAVADLVMPADSRGVFMKAVVRIGERFEAWLNLYGQADGGGSRTILSEGGSDVIVDYLESKTLDLHRGFKDRRRDRPD